MDPHNFHMTSYMGTYVRVSLNQHWMAPEILNNETYTLKADVYSFAVGQDLIRWSCGRF